MSMIELHVDRLFQDAPPQCGELCKNPVTGGYYIADDNSISLQKRFACRALLARELFAVYGPRDAPPLPISDPELDDLKDSNPFNHIFSCFAYSLRAHDWDFNSHPSFEDFARGALASVHAPLLVHVAKVLHKRYPPRRLRGLGPGLCWQPGH